MQVQTKSVFRFGAIEVREDEFRATRAGQPLDIEPKAFRVLVYLLQHAGHLVSKSELMNAVWGDTAVTENSLTRAIALLRRVLEDDPHQPHFIETVSTAGYRFICPVETDASPDTPVESRGTTEGMAPPSALSSKARPRFLRCWRWALAASAAGVAVAAGAFLWYIHQPLPSPHIGETRQLTRDVRWRFKRPLGVERGRVYFTGRPQGLFAVASSGDIETILPQNFVWDISPEGDYFLSDRGNNSLWVFSTTGKPVRYLADGSPAAWSPDGKQVIYAAEDGKVYTIPTEGGEPHFLFTSPSPSDTWYFAWSPDGKRIRFNTDSDRIWEVASDGSNLHEFLPGMKGSVIKCCGRWTPDGAFYIFVSSKKVPASAWEGSQLWSLDERSGKFRKASHEPVQLTFGPMQWTHPLSSRDSRTIFATGILNQGELVRFDTRTRQFARYLGGISADWLEFSRDGKYLAYISYPDQKIWRANRDGSDRILLAQPQGPAYGIRWSPDGARILFVVTFAGARKSEVYIISCNGGRPERVQFPPGENPVDPTWSSDGRHLAYSMDSMAQPTPRGIRILDLETHRSSPLPAAPLSLWSPRWSPDGRFIFCFAVPTGSAVFDTKTRRWVQFPEKIDVGWPNWAHDSRSVYFLSNAFGATQADGVYRISIPSGDTERVIDLTNFRFWGSLGTAWLGLDPEDHPILLRDAGSIELYALTLERK